MISKCPLDTRFVHALLHLLLIREGYLAWFENEALRQGKEACKLKTPSLQFLLLFIQTKTEIKEPVSLLQKASVSVSVQTDPDFFPRCRKVISFLSFELPVRLAFFHIPVHDRPFLSTVVKTLSRLAQTEQQIHTA